MSHEIKRCMYDNPDKWQREFWRDGELLMTISETTLNSGYDRYVERFLGRPFSGRFRPGRIIGTPEAMEPRKEPKPRES